MTRTNPLRLLLGVLLTLAAMGGSAPPRRDERGLSQSTENAILLAGAVTIAGLVIAAVTVYVQGKLPK